MMKMRNKSKRIMKKKMNIKKQENRKIKEENIENSKEQKYIKNIEENTEK